MACNTFLSVMLRALLVGLVLTVPVGLAGQVSVGRTPGRWLRLDRRPGMVIYIDRLRTTRVDVTHVETWVRYDVADTVLRTPKKVDQILDRWVIDCVRVEAVSVETAAYYRGDLVEQFVVPLERRILISTTPEGLGEVMVSSACLIAKGEHVDSVP